jgi:hypothetical protein
MPGMSHGPSILWPRVYEALRRKGASKSKAARISNSMVQKGYRVRSRPSGMSKSRKGIASRRRSRARYVSRRRRR